MHPNFMHFCRKISFKSALEIFTPVSGHFRIAFKYKSLKFSDFVFMESLSTTVYIKITFSNLKSVECFEFDKKNFETTHIDVKKGF